MRILSARQCRPIQLREKGFVFPLDFRTKLVLDKKSPSHKKCHELTFQQGRCFGQEGDCCEYLNNEKLLELEAKGMILIQKSESYKTTQK